MNLQNDATVQMLKKVRRVEIRTRRMVTDAMSGAYHSVFKGRGMDFEEVREYQPGDEVRFIDWNVTARMNRPFVKKFREERELTIMLMVDVSASGLFGSNEQSKRELAAELASVLAFAAIRNNDKVGLLLFSDQVEAFIPPKKGKMHVLRVIREVLFCKPKHVGTNFTEALRYLNRVVKRKSVVFLLSDFLISNKSQWRSVGGLQKTEAMKALALTNKRHDVSCIVLEDRHERELPNVGVIVCEDAETGQQIELDTGSARNRARYAQMNMQRRDALERGLRSVGVDYFFTSTGTSYIVDLKRFLMSRARRR